MTENTNNPPYKNLAEFYPYYLSEHSDKICRRMHFIGTSLVILTVVYALLQGPLTLLWLLPVLGYGFAWVGHYVFEKNRPATFQHPFYSLVSDFIMYRDMLTGRVSF